jgi:DNA-binding XRE family transcriptional regulator
MLAGNEPDLRDRVEADLVAVLDVERSPTLYPGSGFPGGSRYTCVGHEDALPGPASGCSNTAGALLYLTQAFSQFTCSLSTVYSKITSRWCTSNRKVSKMETLVKIGDTVRRERLKQTLRQDELARLAGITPTTLSRIERNESEPHVSTIRKLADVLGVSASLLIEGEED